MKFRIFPPKRRVKIVLSIVAGAAVLLAGDMLYVKYLRRIRISPNTTVITAPLTADGMPDYIAALNAELSKGVTPENNAAPDILRLVRMQPFISGSAWGKAILPTLGISFEDMGPKIDHYFRWRDDLERKKSVKKFLPDDLVNAIAQEAYDITNKTWRAENHPMAVQWLKQQEGLLSEFCELTKKSRLYLPRIRAYEGEVFNGEPPYHSFWIPCIAMEAQTHFAIGEGDRVTTERNILSSLRFARMLPSTQSRDVANAYRLDISAWEAVQSAATTRDFLNVANATQWIHELAAFSLPESPSGLVTISDRYLWMDRICEVARVGWANIAEAHEREQGFMNPDSSDETLRLAAVLRPYHFDSMLRTANQLCDQVIAGLGISDEQERKKYFRELEISASDVATARFARGAFDSEVIHDENQPGVRKQALVARKLALTALSLRLYHLSHKAYPKTLDDLVHDVPSLLLAIPMDDFANAPLKYHLIDNGYLLYGVGPDGEDNGGIDRESAEKSHPTNGQVKWDMVVRCKE